MEDKYCDYRNEEWVKKFNNLKNGNHYTEVEGNTIYIKEFLEPHQESVYVKNILGLYKKKIINVVGKRQVVTFLVMCKCHEITVIEWLESNGFVVA